MKNAHGFTLIELLVVVVIIGILAAIAVPRMSRGAEAAAEVTIRADLAILRNAIAHYAAEHEGVYPAAKSDGPHPAGSNKAFPSQLLLYSNIDGLTSTSPSAAFPYGPYLKAMPVAPLGPAKGDNRITVKLDGVPLSGNKTPGRAWKYDALTGEIIFKFNGTSSDGTTYDQW